MAQLLVGLLHCRVPAGVPPAHPTCPLQASSSPLGSSPLGSFESEWLAFMTSSISHGRSKQRRRSQRGMGGPGVAKKAWCPVSLAACSQLCPTGVAFRLLLCRSAARGPRHLPPEARGAAAAVDQAPALWPVGGRLWPQWAGGEAEWATCTCIIQLHLPSLCCEGLA